MTFVTRRARRRLRTAAMTAALGLSGLFALGAQARGQVVEVGDGGPGPVKAEHLTVELVSLAPQIGAGGQLQIGLSFTIEEKWHVYWLNAGDSGEPPTIKWTLPKGVTAGPLQFPGPQRLPLGPLMDFGYEDQVTFPVTLSAAPKTKPGKVHLDARVSWLVCASQCLPGKAHLGIDLTVVRPPVPDPPLVGALGAAITALPRPLPANMTVSAVGDAKHILVTLKTGGRETDAEFYPIDQEVIENAADQPVDPLDDGISIRLQRASDAKKPSGDAAEELHGLIKLSDKEEYLVTVHVKPGVVPGGVAAAPTAATEDSSVTLPRALGLAFLGGILLNLMPCVFPVLFLKGLALVNSTHQERGRQRAHGFVYTLGIVVSFWAVVAVLLLLRSGGQQLGWGFQLQSPGFVAVLAAMMFFLALSLAGQFELGLSLTSTGGELAQKQGFTGSFFTGVLATIVATPCTGPLMGAAIGFAMAQPPWMTFLVFTALALGLAFPYLLLTAQPEWARLLPKPGAWMEILKQLTAVPLFATAIWLVWIYGHLYEPDGVDRTVRLLACFLLLAIAGWALGRWPARWGSGIAATVLIVGALALPLRKPTAEVTAWQPYSAASFAQARASGKPLFVDFTAAWCLSCQVNERVVLRSDAVQSKFAASHVILMKADWTKYDPEITQQLSAVGRSGVPTYVMYAPGKNSNADVLPEVLTQSIVLKALERDTKEAN